VFNWVIGWGDSVNIGFLAECSLTTLLPSDPVMPTSDVGIAFILIGRERIANASLNPPSEWKLKTAMDYHVSPKYVLYRRYKPLVYIVYSFDEVLRGYVASLSGGIVPPIARAEERSSFAGTTKIILHYI
jgi:hypothetical protein